MSVESSYFRDGKIPPKRKRGKDDHAAICSFCGELTETEVEVYRGRFVKVPTFVDAHPRCVKGEWP